MVIKEIGRYNILQMFKEEFRNIHPDAGPYASFVNNFLMIFFDDDVLLGSLLQNKVIDFLVEFGITSLDHPTKRDE